MNKLFETDIETTYEAYSKYSKFIANKEQNFMTKVILCFILYFVLGIGFMIYENDLFFFIVLAIAAFVFLYVVFAKRNKNIKKAWDSNVSMQHRKAHYDFYEDKFVVTLDDGTMSHEYSKIYKVYDNKEYIYLMLSNIEGHIFLKENCSKELIEFLLEKNKKKENK